VKKVFGLTHADASLIIFHSLHAKKTVLITTKQYVLERYHS
jgi:hypothetical protein